MSEQINAFTFPLGISGSEFTRASLDERMIAARLDIITLIPAIKNLYHSVVVETYLVQDNQFVMKVQLAFSNQLSLDFSPSTSSRKKSPPILQKLFEDWNRIFESAESSQFRISELANRIAIGASTPSEYSANTNFELSDEDIALLKYCRRNIGKTIKISFINQDIDLQIPLIPHYTSEPGTRIIRASIKNISPTMATLNSIKLIDEIGCSNSNANLTSGSMNLHRTQFVGVEVWGLLDAAMHKGIEIDIEVKVALISHNNKPAYLELCQINNKQKLLENFELFYKSIMRI